MYTYDPDHDNQFSGLNIRAPTRFFPFESTTSPVHSDQDAPSTSRPPRCHGVTDNWRPCAIEDDLPDLLDKALPDALESTLQNQLESCLPNIVASAVESLNDALSKVLRDTLPDALGADLSNALNSNMLGALESALLDALELTLPIALKNAITHPMHLLMPKALAQAIPVALKSLIEQRVEDIMSQKMTPIRIMTAKMYNRAAADGRVIPYEPVPFRDGRLPQDVQPATRTVWQYCILPIYKADDLCTLSQDNVARYLKLYYPSRSVPDSLTECRVLLARAIGNTTFTC
ncbi:hypothetical protein HGRIS_007384 [Hohenbuehelia grisea]|uniref:Mug135-like C-terminal domain-containing protein n=1 Tax=Hohenbuehelia grisea TaxID=104357 RepID=A0ABR3J4T8_9AGAR